MTVKKDATAPGSEGRFGLMIHGLCASLGPFWVRESPKKKLRRDHQERCDRPGVEDRFGLIILGLCASLGRFFSEETIPVLVPTPVIGEFLTGRDRDVRLRLVDALTHFADVIDFDLRAATLASELRTSYWERHKRPKGLKGQVLSVDMMIAATAIVNQATMIVTHDIDDFQRIVGDRTVIRGIMDGPPGQGSLFH